MTITSADGKVWSGGWSERLIIQEMCQEAAEHHRLLSSTLYMAKPNTANTVAPTLALSQKVEFLRSAWLTCLCNRKRRHTEGDKLSQSGTDWVDPNEWVWNVKIQIQMDDVISFQQKQHEKMIKKKSETKTETDGALIKWSSKKKKKKKWMREMWD